MKDFCCLAANLVQPSLLCGLAAGLLRFGRYFQLRWQAFKFGAADLSVCAIIKPV